MNTKPKVVVTDYAFPDLNTEEQILAAAGCNIVGCQCKTEADLTDLCRDADAVITQFARVNANVISVMGRARVIVRYGVGYDTVHYEAATTAGIMIGHCPHYCLDEVATHAFALLAALKSGKVAMAALDVFEREPLSSESPLRRHPRLLLSNHAAWYSEDAEAELHRSVAEDAVRVCTGGLPVSLANPEVLHKMGRFDEWKPTWNARWRSKRAAALKSES